MRLLLLEDDELLGSGLRDFLVSEGHEVTWATRLSDLLPRQYEDAEALLVDWQLPDGSGLDWLRSLRQRGVATPALMLTARDLLADRLQGLDSGADDYLVKPFAPEELAARLRAVSRRHMGASSSHRQYGDVWLDLAAKRARRGGLAVELTAREWAVLEALAQRAGRLYPKHELELRVLGTDAEVQSNALEVHISSLRRKLGRSLIETVRGMGYRLGA
ncbi:response regulator transcription factor [Roseateles depolymerans]|uniref:Winged helix family two component transcriptional regulator n=1 Tax=Roseateles depolymerans TaxID=76731 RepID=A0A0U2UBM2_9BURK|nr:response regulator transcription factor [Roseateles depolymerans]ALV09265.1 Winged helix family two component transcriptional regulator [Roseateles depolymerans]REG14025.1 two-component system OmpR family response regulator [Roseateles depolymerans]